MLLNTQFLFSLSDVIADYSGRGPKYSIERAFAMCPVMLLQKGLKNMLPKEKDRNLGTGIMVFEQYYIEPVYLEREVNYEVSQDGQYLFRLVPGSNGFELSKLDRALGAEVDINLADRIGQFIVVSEA